MTGVERLCLYFPGRHILGPGRQLQQIYGPGKPPGRISSGHLDRLLECCDPLRQKPFLSQLTFLRCNFRHLVIFECFPQLSSAIYWLNSSVEIQIEMDQGSYSVLKRNSVYNELIFQNFRLFLKEARLICSCCRVIWNHF